jgi:Protein of unknown function (DUF2934)
MPILLESPAALPHDLISLVAYLSWEARGKTDGSPADDWLRAERELRSLDGMKKERPASDGVTSNPLVFDPSVVEHVSSVLDSFLCHVAVDYYSCLT